MESVFLSWKFHYSTAKQSAVTKTFTVFGMELEINSSPSAHSYESVEKVAAEH
jgi:hypothetical protein